MAEWLVERGIGEDRALLIGGGDVLAAKLRWPGEPWAGEAVMLRLASKPAGARRGIAHDGEGREILVDRLPAALTEGVSFPATITRAAMAERGRFKRPLARADMAESTEVAFAGGTLLFSPTPAMTLVDIDGALPPRELALAAVPALARALRRFDIGGSIGVDFPTLSARGDRRAVDEALGEALAGWPHERTAMNGFGFVQIVARLEGPSLLHRLTFRRRDAAIRMALRRAERVEGAGVTLLTLNPALEPLLRPEWRAELERRTGRALRVVLDDALALTAGAAQIVAA